MYLMGFRKHILRHFSRFRPHLFEYRAIALTKSSAELKLTKYIVQYRYLISLIQVSGDSAVQKNECLAISVYTMSEIHR